MTPAPTSGARPVAAPLARAAAQAAWPARAAAPSRISGVRLVSGARPVAGARPMTGSLAQVAAGASAFGAGPAAGAQSVIGAPAQAVAAAPISGARPVAGAQPMTGALAQVAAGASAFGAGPVTGAPAQVVAEAPAFGAPPAAGARALPGRAARAARPVGTPAPEPRCGDAASGADFPISTRVHGGPDAYAPGGDWQSWAVELRNTTGAACHGVHPVAVVVDEGRALTDQAIELDFYDPGARAWRDVRFETTDRDEHIGVFDGGFPGFEVPAGRTVTVTVRLRFPDRVAEDRVRLSVAAVQRRADDGAWVGTSEPYAFAIRREERPSPDDFVRPEATGPGPWAAELARTGGRTHAPAHLATLTAVAAALLATGGAAYALSRRLRR
ncbi:hypothetical protein ACSNOD_13865 [Streptomyces sp. URMC 123]